MKFLTYALAFSTAFLLYKFNEANLKLDKAPKPPTTWCFQVGENVGRVEEYEKYLVIFDNSTGDFLQAGPVEMRNSINLMFATVDCK